MRTLKLYSNDFSKPGNARDTECSAKVIGSWFDPMTRYAVEDISDARCLRLVAERLVLRKLLGLMALDEGFEKLVLPVEVFGFGSPTFSELSSEKVFVAMAFVPLTPLDERGRPYLARLYCVSGLSNRHANLPLEGIDDPRLQSFSWFLEGVPRGEIDRGIVGRSWLLAARLLTEVVRKRDVQTARNLAKRFIVTGDVDGDVIRKVEIKRKGELAKQFEGFKWIIPEENDMDISKRKIEKPATLDEAYKLIETMQNKATRSFFRFLKSGDLAGMKEQCEIGADLFASDADTGLAAMPLIANRMRSAEIDSKGMSWPRNATADKEHLNEFAAAKKAEQYREIRSWLRTRGADPVMMFYVLAKSGLIDVLRQVLKVWPIDARDEDGYNVVELALRNRDYALAKELYALGGRCGANFADDSMTAALKSYVGAQPNFIGDRNKEEPKESRKAVEFALMLGLSPDCHVAVEGRIKTTLFGAALYRCDVGMVRKCLEAGADSNLDVEIWEGCHNVDEPGWCWTLAVKGSPLYVVNCGNGNVEDEARIAATELLGQFGAHSDNKIAKCQYERAVNSLDSNAASKKDRECILRSLSEGFPHDVLAKVLYLSCEENPRFEYLLTTLWGWAVYNGDIEIMRKCLEMGANVNGALKFAHCDQNHVADLQYLNGRTPVEVVLMSEDLTLERQNEALEVLKSYGLKDDDCPRVLMENRHLEELSKLNCLDDVEVNRNIALDDRECPEIASTNALGMAAWYMWVDVIERCLSLGASARNTLHYWGTRHYDDTYEAMSGTPREIIDKCPNVPAWRKNRAIKLLAKYSNK